MRGFYMGTGRVRCGFCGSIGHNITTCKLVDYYAGQALSKIERDNEYECDSLEKRALMEMKKRPERKIKLQKPKSPARCSYCKSLSHKRPKCHELKDFRQLVYKANKNWKREFTHRINEVGLGVGALVEFDKYTANSLDFNLNQNNIAMIVNYDLGNLNVFCGLDGYSDYQGNSTMEISLGERSDIISIKYFSTLLGNDLLHKGWWYSQSRPVVLSRMQFKANEEWLESEWDEVMDWFFKSAKKERLNTDGIMKYLNKWADYF